MGREGEEPATYVNPDLSYDKEGERTRKAKTINGIGGKIKEKMFSLLEFPVVSSLCRHEMRDMNIMYIARRSERCVQVRRTERHARGEQKANKETIVILRKTEHKYTAQNFLG